MTGRQQVQAIGRIYFVPVPALLDFSKEKKCQFRGIRTIPRKIRMTQIPDPKYTRTVQSTR
jgi:hypothetical protein